MKALDLLRDQIVSLTEQRDAAIEAMEAVATAAVTEERALSTEDSTEVEARQAEITDIDAKLVALTEREAELVAIEERTAELAKRPTINVPNINRGIDPLDMTTIAPGAAGASEARARVASVIEESRSYQSQSHRERAAEITERHDPRGNISRQILALSDPAYERAWSKAVIGQEHMLDSDERNALQRAMSLTDSAGGYLIPPHLDPSVILTSTGSYNPFRRVARVIPFDRDVWNGVSTAGVAAGFAAEAAEASDNSPTLAQPSITVKKAHSFIPVSIEAVDDVPGLAGELVRLFSDAKDRLEAQKFTSGTGTLEPWGITVRLSNTNTLVTNATNNAFAIADLFTLQNSLDIRYRDESTAAWMGNNAIINQIRQFGTNVGGYSYTVDLQSPSNFNVLGRPVVENPWMSTTVTGTIDKFLAYGDWSTYAIVDRVGMSIEYIPHLFGDSNRPTGQRGWYMRWRVGADITTPVEAGSIKLLFNQT